MHKTLTLVTPLRSINLVPNFIDLKLYSNCEDNNLPTVDDRGGETKKYQ